MNELLTYSDARWHLACATGSELYAGDVLATAIETRDWQFAAGLTVGVSSDGFTVFPTRP